MDFIHFIILLFMMALNIASYNSRGLGAGRMDYIKKLSMSHDLIFIQEHWQLEENLNIFHKEIPSLTCHGISAMDSSQLLTGRPHGGCAILWNSSLAGKIDKINTSSHRICAVTYTTKDTKVLFVSVYMPTDTENDKSNVNIYNEVLAETSALLIETGCDRTIFGGDYNTDFARLASLHTPRLCEFMRNESIIEPSSEIDYTYFKDMDDGHKIRSWLDHFFVSDNMKNDVLSYGVLHHGDNLSDHCAIYLSIDLSVEHISSTETTQSGNRDQWDKATSDQIRKYEDKVSSLLDKVHIPLEAINCPDRHCKDHKKHVDAFMNGIFDAVQSASKCSIPQSKSGGSKPVPGWNDHVRALRDESLFWHEIWHQCGEPHVGVVAQLHRSTRAKYHQIQKDIANQKKDISASKMADSLLSNKSRDLWTEVKKINNSTKSVPSQVDGKSTDSDIASVFAENYEQVYNSVSYDSQEMHNLQSTIESKIHSECCKGTCGCNHSVSTERVVEAVKLLKRGKSDGILYTDHLINGGLKLHTFISLLFTAMTRHGYCPPTLLASTIIPIPKNMRKSLNDSGNYRGIALNSPFSKLFEMTILCAHRDILSTSDLQFGYKKKLSTVSCTFVADEVIEHYLNGGANVHVMLLDASKAFDCVNYITLFNQLIDKGLCPTVIRIVLALHMFQSVCVRWNSEVSESFSVTNGVKQGGILSPVLFSVYTDSLLEELKKSGVGCHLYYTFAGALAYADDIILLCPTKSSLLHMLKIASDCAEKLSLKFNASKSQYIIFSNRNDNRNNSNNFIIFSGTKVESIDKGLHLGNIISMNSRVDSVRSAIHDLYHRTNVLLSRFSYCTPDTRYKLFKSYCVIAYGCPLWDHSHSIVNEFYTAWRKCVRRVWGLSNMTHCALLPGICMDRSIEHQMLSRSINFIKNSYSSENLLVKNAILCAMKGSNSAVSRTIAVICDKFNVNRINIANGSFYIPYINWSTSVTGAIRDFSQSVHAARGPDRQILNEILVHLCTF